MYATYRVALTVDCADAAPETPPRRAVATACTCHCQSAATLPERCVPTEHPAAAISPACDGTYVVICDNCGQAIMVLDQRLPLSRVRQISGLRTSGTLPCDGLTVGLTRRETLGHKSRDCLVFPGGRDPHLRRPLQCLVPHALRIRPQPANLVVARTCLRSSVPSLAAPSRLKFRSGGSRNSRTTR